ncbi:MAG TPA: cupredoxin domain-containing protein [Candidatus Bilamarchaeum sp.]|nr:cupredoxin domain-containing protein [Candidatus Bilamarchaeum sp.]
MADEIRIHKGLVLALGLFMVLAAAAYVVNAAPGQQGAGQPDQLAPAAGGAPIIAPTQPAAQLRKGGCGCGGGGVACGGGGAAVAPDPSKAVLLNGSNPQEAVQDIYIKALSDGTYDRNEVTVKKGTPVRLHFTADPNAGCGRQLVIYGMNIRASSLNGEEGVVDFIPQAEGTYEYSCGMRMWGPGKLVVV